MYCSAGIGRTGTYLGLDYLLDEAAAGDHVDVLTCVNKLRKNRVDMVQTVVSGAYSGPNRLSLTLDMHS
mgnify:CR=1 FL=1